MPYYRKNYFKNYFKRRWRRLPYRRRRFRKPFRPYRRQRRVRRKRFYRKKFKKFKRLRLLQYQPEKIRKCKIKGWLCMFHCGKGRQNNNYVLFKESFTPPHYPGGGGWSIQTLSLGTLFEQNNLIQNYWTVSNYRLNMCRYLGCKITCYREQFVDWVFHYFNDPPNNVTKYYYASFHPEKMLQLNHKLIIPSYTTQPNNKKPYKSIFIPPPKIFENKWFFQQQLSSYKLLYMAACAVSLRNTYGNYKEINNNTSFYSLNTQVYTNPYMNFPTTEPHQYGYVANSHHYYWGIDRMKPKFTENKISQLIYLGSTLNEMGKPDIQTSGGPQKNNWGNPYHFHWLTSPEETVFSSATQDPATYQTQSTKDQNLTSSQQRTTLNIIPTRYNPYKDKGKGNRVYFIPNNSKSQTTWEPTSDPDILLENFPIWIMLWGFEDVVKKMGKCRELDENWMLVIQSPYFDNNEPFYVPLSDYFVGGQGPYDTRIDDIDPWDYSHWFVKYKFQREAVHNIILTGPFVPNPDEIQTLQAKIKYIFYFKWGGNPSPMEQVFDPNSQPITPHPGGLQLYNEIIDPNTDIQSFLYPWDIRRDIITLSAAERIKQSQTHDIPMFTDGTETSTDFTPWKTTPQAKETQEEKEATLLQQLQQLQQLNNQLQLRFIRLKSSLMDQ
nr:MAG: ORF1 [TTV-like mini virus]